MQNTPYLIEFIQNEENEVIGASLQVMTGFMKPNSFVRLLATPNFSNLEEFESKVLADLPDKKINAIYPDVKSRLEAVETEVLSAALHKKIIEMLQVEDLRNEFAGLLAANDSTYYLEFCNKYNLIPNRLKELWGIEIVSEELNTGETTQE